MSGERLRAPINNSSAKQQFAFSKSARFAPYKANTHAFGYEIPGQFGHINGTGANKGFSTSQKRMEAPRKNSSDALDGPCPIDRNGRNFGKTMQYSFGVSRSQMKKLYVDEILNTGKVTGEPGPDRYTMEAGFGLQKNNGSLYSMRPKNDPFVQHLEKSKKLPGPGNYFATVDLAGKSQMHSRLKNQPSNAFEKAADRFRITTFNNPSGTDYTPKVNLNENVKS